MIRKVLLTTLFFAIFFIPTLIQAATSSGYAWSESLGYFDFSNVTVSDSNLTGYAYNDNAGFLNMDGVTNNNGSLSGYAWSESVGYFDFSDASILNNSFSGYAYNDNTGFLNMDAVTTTWSPTSVIIEEDEESSSKKSGHRRSSLNLSMTGNDPSDENFNQNELRSVPDNIRLIVLLILEKKEKGEPIMAETLLPLIEALREGGGIGSSESVFNRDLEIGFIDEQVKQLQIFLNTNGYAVSDEGPGSAGKETNVFGPLTQQALIKFQQDNNINPSVGYFGPITREFISNNY